MVSIVLLSRMNREPLRRRKHERAETLVLLYVAEIDKPETSTRAAIVDISMGGVSFDSTGLFEKGTPMAIRFTVDNKVNIFEGLVVRRTRKDGMFNYGIKFDNQGFLKNMKKKKIIVKIKVSGSL